MKLLKNYMPIKNYLILLMIISSNLINIISNNKFKFNLSNKSYKFSISKYKSNNNNNNYKNITENENENKNNKKSYKYQIKLRKYKRNPSLDNNIFLKFLLGFGIGYGLSIEASEDLKKCFIENKKEQTKSIKQFFNKANNNDLKDISEKDKLLQKDLAITFIKMVIELLTHLKKCPAFRQTFFTFVKFKIINLTIKGIAYVLAGPLGILIKSTYDIYKLISEIINYYKLRNKIPFDFFHYGIFYRKNSLLFSKFITY
jgi:hypothetical protein